MLLDLAEWQHGYAEAIGYPGIISCMTVTCRYRSAGKLGGVHLTVNAHPSAGRAATHIGQVEELVGGIDRGLPVQALYIVGNFTYWRASAAEPTFQNRARLLTRIAGWLGFTGTVRSFDTAALGASGTSWDLELTSNTDGGIEVRRCRSPTGHAYVAPEQRFGAAGFSRIHPWRFQGHRHEAG